MTTHGTDRLRRSLDNQRKQGAMTYAMPVEDMEALVREVEDERDDQEEATDGWAARCAELMRGDGLPAEVTVVEVDTAGEWDDSADFAPRAVFADEARAEAYAAALKSNGERVWVVKGIAVDPAVPDSWAAVESDAVSLDKAQYAHYDALFNAAGLVARCKRLAGVD